MKNKKILFSSLVALLSFSTLIGCGENNNKSTSSSQITSSVNQELITQRAELQKLLNNLKKGLKLVGSVEQQLNLLDGYHGNKTGTKINITYNAEYIYEMGNEMGYSAYVTYEEEGYPEEEFINLQAFQGEDGYTYYDSYNYDNTVERLPYYMGDDQKVNFGYYCLNPFDYLLPEDFTKISDDTYSLNKGKSSFLASNIFGDISAAFEQAIVKCEFKVENGQFKSFLLEPVQYHDSMTDTSTHSAVYYYADFVANMEFKEIGSAQVKDLLPREDVPETKALQDALNKFTNKNYSVRLHGHDTYKDYNNVVTKEDDLYEYFYYDGKDVFMNFLDESVGDDPSVYEENNTQYSEQNEHGIMSFFGCSYDNLVPKMSEVDAAIFDYNQETGLYSICNEMLSYIATIAIVPVVSRFTLDLSTNTTAFNIKLDENGDIEYVNVKYATASSAYNVCYGDIMLTFFDIDNTKIPHGVKTY